MRGNGKDFFTMRTAFNLKTAVARIGSSQDLGDKAVCRDATDLREICAAAPHRLLAQAFANLRTVRLPF